MKKIICVILSVLMLLGVAGCGNNSSTTNQGSSETTAENQAEGVIGNFKKPVFTINGVAMEPGAMVDPVIKALGDPVEYSEAASCYYDGMDKIYGYDGFEIRTYPKDGTDYILEVSVASDKYKTEEGLTVGVGKDDFSGSEVFNSTAGASSFRMYYDETKYIYFFILNDKVKYFGISFDNDNA